MSMILDHTETVGRRDDDECQATAREYLRELIGAAPDDLLWDDIHHLQGHAHCAGKELVVIAARDAVHHTLVVSPEDWDAIRHATGPERCDLMRACAIESHDRLLQVLDNL